MKKINWKFSGVVSLILLIFFFASPIVAEISSETTTETVEQETKVNKTEKKTGFFEKLFSRKKSESKNEENTEEKKASETKEQKEADKANNKEEKVVEKEKKKEPGFFEKLFSKKKDEKKSEVKAEEKKTVETTANEEKIEADKADSKADNGLEKEKKKEPGFFEKLFSKKKKENKKPEKTQAETAKETKLAEEKITEETKPTEEKQAPVIKATDEQKTTEVDDKVVEKEPGFFEKLFSKKKKEHKEENVVELPEEVILSEKEVVKEDQPKAQPSIFGTWLKRKLSFKQPFSGPKYSVVDTAKVEEEPEPVPSGNVIVKAKESDQPKTSLIGSIKSIFKSKKKEEPTSEGKSGFQNPFKKLWNKSEPIVEEKALKKAPSPFHDPKQLSTPKYTKKSPSHEAPIGVIGDVKGEKVGPFSRPGKYGLSGTETGLLLPINNQDELNTKADTVAVIMKQPALMSVDSYSSLSLHKIITINEIILKRGRFRLKTLKGSGLWTIRGRESLLSISEETDVVFDMTGTLITKIFVIEGKAHCLPKIGEKPVQVEAGKMIHLGLSETRVDDLKDEQTEFFKSRFSLSSEETLAKKLDAAGVFETRTNKNWPYESKIYSGILCTNCAYAFDAREDYYDVCPICHVSLIEIPKEEEAPEVKEEEDKKEKKPTKRKNYKWSDWFFGILPKSKAK